jgi:DNA-binding transcriptional regulator of glucitol operon
MLKIEGHDDAIIGPALIWRNNTMVNVLVYDAEVIRNTLVTRDAMAFDDAREYIEFNIEGAYMGEHTPVLVWPYDEWSEE